MSRTRPLCALLLFMTPFSACFCEDDPLEKLAPKIEIIDAFNPEQSPCDGEVPFERNTNCSFAYGEVPITQGRFFRIHISNDSPIVLRVSDLQVTGDPAFKLSGEYFTEAEPLLLVPPQSDVDDGLAEAVEVTVRYTPVVEGAVTGQLVITSDAVNHPDYVPAEEGQEPDPVNVVIELTGSGVDLGRPQIEVTPEACNFGEVGVGVASFCEISVKNIGTRDLQIDAVDFSEDTLKAEIEINGTWVYDPTQTGFGIQTFILPPIFIAPQTAQSVRLHANPESVGEMTGALLIESNDPGNDLVEVPLSVTGADVPTAVAEVLSINGTPNNDPSPTVQPLDDVVLTGENSVDANGDPAGIMAYAWEIVSAPNESSAVLSTPNDVTTGFTFESAAGTVAGLDFAGTYEIKLTVTDDGGRMSTNDARVTLQSIPDDALHIQLSWDSPDWDYDLHVIKDGGPWCHQVNDCHFANCKADSLFPPEWDGVAGRTDGDPTLDIDDREGFGPENINIDVPITGDYTVGVHAYSGPDGAEDVYTTVKIFVYGGLAYEATVLMNNDEDFWEVAEISWSGGNPTLFPVSNEAVPNGLASVPQCN